MKNKMKRLHTILSGIAAVCMLIIVLITAFEIAVYSDYGWYEKEYEKYEVLTDLEMEMPQVMEVTREMMAYLRGNKKDLVVDTIVDGVEREFFNDREKTHMVDVKNLFLGGLWIRRIAVIVLLMAILGLMKSKARIAALLPKAFLIGTGGFIAVTLGAGMIFLSDFNKYFTMFHELFFTNDLWLLDPDTDLLIRMLPEGFFLDMVVRIGTVLLILMGTALIISIGMLIWQRNKKN